MYAIELLPYLLALYEGLATFLFMQILIRFIRGKIKQKKNEYQRLEELDQRLKEKQKN